MNQYQGDYRRASGPVAIIASRYNPSIVDQLIAGAKEALADTSIAEDQVDLLSVPGAFEIPQLAGRLAATGRYRAIVTLGCVVRGETPHFDYVAGECARGISQLALRYPVAMVFGVLTTDTFAQAQARSRGRESNKGFEAMASALEMVHLNQLLEDS